MPNSPEIDTMLRLKVKSELTNSIYPSLFTTLPLLALCAGMLIFKLNGHVNKTYLITWLAAFLTVTAGQAVLATWFSNTKDTLKWNHLYFKLLMIDVGLIGMLWGSAGVLFMPEDMLGQSYLIFILAVVAAGGPLYLAGSYLAGSVYATGILIPLVGSLVYSFFSQTHHEIYFNITLWLVFYWSFLLALTYYSSKLSAENLIQNLVNKALTEDLSQANEELEMLNAVSRKEQEKLFLSTMGEIAAAKTPFQHIEYTDAVTNTDTKEILNIKFIQSRAYARRHQQSLAVFVININNYHEVHGSGGDEIGNLLMKTAAIRLQYCKRDTDILSRMTDNQFVLVISEVLLGNEIMVVANKILKMFAEKTLINESKIQIDASMGISIYPKDGLDLPDLIQQAETALGYLSTQKEAGSEVFFQVYDPDIMVKTVSPASSQSAELLNHPAQGQ